MSKKKLSKLQELKQFDELSPYIKLIEVLGVIEDHRDEAPSVWYRQCYQILINILTDPDFFPDRWGCTWDSRTLEQNDRGEDYYNHITPRNMPFQFNSQEHVDYLNAQEAQQTKE